MNAADALRIEFSARNQETRPTLERITDVDTGVDDNSAARTARRSMGAVHPLVVPPNAEYKEGYRRVRS